MGSIQPIVASLLGVTTLPEENGRTKPRRAPQCEALEGRQLLNGSWGGAGTHDVWSGMVGGPGLGHGGPAAAHIGHWSGAGALGKDHARGLTFPGHGKASHGMPAPRRRPRPICRPCKLT